MKIADDRLMDRWPSSRTSIDAADLWDLDSQLDVAMEALRCPPDDATVAPSRAARSAGSRSAGLLLSPTSCSSTNRPTTSTPSPSAGSSSSSSSSTAPSSSSRTTATSSTSSPADHRARPRQGHSLPGQLHRLAGTEGEAADRSARGQVAPEDAPARARMGPPGRQGAPAKQKARIDRYNDLAQQSEREKIARAQIIIPTGPRLGAKVIELDGARRRPSATSCCSTTSFSPPPAASSARRPERRGQDHPLPHAHRAGTPDAGAVTLRRDGQAGLRRPVPRGARPDKTVWDEISDGADVIALGDAEMNSRAYCGAFHFKGGDQQKKVGPPLGRRAQPRPPGQAPQARAATSSSSTSPPTTSTWRPCAPSRTPWSTSPAAPW